MGEFTTIKNQIAKLKAATPAAQEKMILSIIKINEEALLNVNRAQLLSGYDADGNRLKRYRNRKYAALKRQMNPRGVTDLRLTGSLYAKMFIVTDKFPILFGSKDSKSFELQAKYGNIFGIQDDNKEMVAQKILRDQIVLYYAGLFQI